ncbi:MAG TPA: M28 family metallopeptidase [Methylomirabilota bacterium]
MRPAGIIVAVLVLAGAAAAQRPISFDAARAWRDLEHIVGLGPRPSGSPALDRTREYLASELGKVGVRTWTQPFVAATALGPVSTTNLVAEIPGLRTDVVLFGGHYDTKFYPRFRFVGANDGASSTAVLLELARRLAIGPRQYTVWVVFFDGEEERDPESNRGALHGSRYFVEALARSGQIGRVRAAVVVDMIGDRELDIRRDSGSAGWLNEIVWTTAGRLGHGRHFLEETVSIEDDHVPFLRAGVPAALLIDYNYGRTPEGRGFWHTPEDTIDKLSPRSLGVVGDVLVNALPAIETSLGRR